MEFAIPGAFGVSPTENLRQYISHATLPSLKIPLDSTDSDRVPRLVPDGHKSHRNHLTVPPGPWRRLETIYSFIGDGLTYALIHPFIESQVPPEPIKSECGSTVLDEPFTMPCKGFHVDQLAMPLVLDVHRFYQWFTRYLVDTAQRLIHIVYPEMNSWGFSTQYDPQNPHLHCIAWASPRIGPLDTVDQCTLAIFIQPPWILAKQDIDSFTKCSYLPPFNNQLTGHIDSKYKLWAKVYDTCVAKGCRYFILSNYNSFALGVFTEGYTTAFVVKGPDCTSTKPNILECLFYWIASSMRVPSSFCVPEVPESFHREGPPNIPPAGELDMLSQVTDGESESSWGGKDDDVPSQAGSWASLSRASSRASCKPHVFDYRRDESVHFEKRKGRYYVVEAWRRDPELEPASESLPAIEEETSSVGSETWSALTSQDVPDEYLNNFWTVPSSIQEERDSWMIR